MLWYIQTANDVVRRRTTPHCSLNAPLGGHRGPEMTSRIGSATAVRCIDSIHISSILWRHFSQQRDGGFLLKINTHLPSNVKSNIILMSLNLSRFTCIRPIRSSESTPTGNKPSGYRRQSILLSLLITAAAFQSQLTVRIIFPVCCLHQA
jgi:hypothetical protein